MSFDVLDPQLELIDPTPDLWALFQQYNDIFFNGALAGCEVRWSSRMTSCAGLCSFQPSSGFCSVRLSQPLLKLRPRADLVNTLLHEMIHAYIFITSSVRDHDDHGPLFQSHMKRINSIGKSKITIYHTFKDEVRSYQKHWWKCNGSCQHKSPFFGIVKRAMNRAPSANDFWWAEHEATCGGSFQKIKEPEGYSAKRPKPKVDKPAKETFFLKRAAKKKKIDQTDIINLCSDSEDEQ